jgi:hypothetical protein
MTERRAATRQRTYLRGVLSYQNGAASADAVVRNLSARGALIELPHPDAPETFELLIPMRNLHGKAQVAWRRGARRGLHFAAAPKAESQVAPAPAPRDEAY